MAITMTVCAVIGGIIASNIVVGAIVGACIGAMLALTVLYKIDPTVEPIVKLFGITDEDITTGYTTVTPIYEPDFFYTIRNRLAVEYGIQHHTASQYVYGFAKYGDNQFRSFNMEVPNYKACFTKDLKTEKTTLQKQMQSLSSDSTEYKAKQTRVDAINKEIDTYIQDVAIMSDGLNASLVRNMLVRDMKLSSTPSIDYSFIGNVQDSAWCRYNLQLRYGFDHINDTCIINKKIYTYVSETYVKSSNTYQVTLLCTDGTTKVESVPNIQNKMYCNIRYVINSIPYLWIKPLEVETGKFGVGINAYNYVLADGTKIQLKLDNAKSYIDAFPVVCFKHKKHFVNEYSTVKNDFVITKTIYDATREIMRRIGIDIDDFIAQFADSDKDNVVEDAFFVWGIPLTTRTEKDKDNKDFKEPEIMSKALYLMFDTLNNNITTSVFDSSQDISSEDKPTVSLIFRQKPYYSSFIWVPMSEIVTNEVIGNPGTYSHNVGNIQVVQEQRHHVTYVGSNRYERGDDYYYTYDYRYYTETFLWNIDGTLLNKSTSLNKNITYNSGDSERVWQDDGNENGSYVNVPHMAGINGGSINELILENGKPIFGLISSLYPNCILYEKTVSGKDYLYSRNSSNQNTRIGEITKLTYGDKDRICSTNMRDDDGNSIVLYVDKLPTGVLSKRTTMTTGKTYVGSDTDTSAVAMVTMKKQISATATNTITILSPVYFSVIRQDEGAVTVASDSVTETDSNVVLPLSMDLINELSLQEKTHLFAISARIVSYVTKTTHLKWYQTEAYGKFTQNVGFVCMIVIAIATFGAGLKPTMTFLQIMTKLATQAAIMVGVSVALKIIAKTVDNPVLRAVLSLAVMLAGAYAAGGLQELDFKTGVQLANSAVKAANIGMQADLENKQEALNDDIAQYEEYLDSNKENIEKIEEYNRQANSGLDALDMVQIYGMSYYGGDNILVGNEGRISIAMEGAYDFDSLYTFPEDQVTNSVDAKKDVEHLNYGW